MKIQINGFDIEVNTEEANMTVKVIDSTGKELSNNTYAQTLSPSEEVQPVQIPSVEETPTAQQAVQETPAQAQPAAQAQTQSEETVQTEESFVPNFESFKKLRNAGKI